MGPEVMCPGRSWKMFAIMGSRWIQGLCEGFVVICTVWNWDPDVFVVVGSGWSWGPDIF